MNLRKYYNEYWLPNNQNEGCELPEFDELDYRQRTALRDSLSFNSWMIQQSVIQLGKAMKTEFSKIANCLNRFKGKKF